MIMKIDNILLDKLAAQAKESPRLRSIMMIIVRPGLEGWNAISYTNFVNVRFMLTFIMKIEF